MILSAGKITGFFLALAVMCLSSACFEVIEEIDVAEDGSGKFKLIFNASESKETLEQYMKLDEVQGIRIPSQLEMEQNLIKAQALIGMSQGISEVQIEKDFSRFVFKLSGKFENINQLNTAMKHLAVGFDPKAFPFWERTSFSFQENSIEREFRIEDSENAYDKLSSSGQYLMDQARVRSIFRLPAAVKSQSNPNAKISPSKKAIMIAATLAELSKKEVSLANKINF